jgi:hypothetical protein
VEVKDQAVVYREMVDDKEKRQELETLLPSLRKTYMKMEEVVEKNVEVGM